KASSLWGGRASCLAIQRLGRRDAPWSHSQDGCATFRPPLLETAPSRGKLIQCGTEIPKPKLNFKRLNVESARFNAAGPLASRAWSNRFSACSKPLAKIR